jgi:hypothetical protein
MRRMGMATRELGFRRVSATTKWLAGCGAALAAVFSVLAARSMPGNGTTGAAPSTPAPTTPAPTVAPSQSLDRGSSSGLGDEAPTPTTRSLQVPVSPPLPTRQRPQVISGGT